MKIGILSHLLNDGVDESVHGDVISAFDASGFVFLPFSKPPLYQKTRRSFV